MSSDLFEEYSKRVYLGDRAREFLSSPVGKYLQERAIEDLQAARDALEVCADREEILKNQNIAWRCRAFMDWLLEAVEVGDEAKVQIQEGGLE